MKRAFITGIAGQDGSYLAEMLLEKGYEVHGLVQSMHAEAVYRIAPILDRVTLHEGDVTNGETVSAVVRAVMPEEFYHLASSVEPKIVFETEQDVIAVDFTSTHHCLRALKQYAPECRFYFASSAAMFGLVKTAPQNELTPVDPITPYGIGKTAGYHLVRMYRAAYGMFAATGILYNHESPRRGLQFPPRKITATAARIKLGLEHELVMGNIEAMRDWGFAKDFAESMWMMLQQNTPEDYVIGTGELHSIKDILDIAFGALDLDWKKFVRIDQALFRPLETYTWQADIAKARNMLGWQPRTSFREMIELMVAEDLKAAQAASHPTIV